MDQMILTTYDWVPDAPRGFVRDLRVRWALKEAGLPYCVASTPFRDRAASHFAHQPFGQVPWLTDDDLTLFESGAILLHIAERSEHLLTGVARRRAEVLQWVFAALNSVEMASLPWSLCHFSGDTSSAVFKMFDQFLKVHRLPHVERVIAECEWLAGRFSVADILMADVLRLVDRFQGLADFPACREYVQRATERPAFTKACQDQKAHFAKADPASPQRER